MIVRPSRRDLLRYGSAAAAAAALPAPAIAQAWPSKPIKIICGYPAGGLTDTFARAYGEAHLAEDRPAGGGREQDRRLGRHRRRAGQERAARRPHADVDDLDHDDHEQGAVQEAALRSRQGLRADLLDGRRPPAVHRHKSVPATNLNEFADYARNNKVSLGTYGAGSYSHCRGRGAEPPFRADHGGGALPRRGADVDRRRLGRGPGRQRQLRRGGRVLQSGNGRPIAVPTKMRMKKLPDVPPSASRASPTSPSRCTASSAWSGRRRCPRRSC